MPRSLDDLSWPRRTERLLIRRATPSDADVIWSYRRLESVSRYMTSLPGELEDFRTAFAEKVDRTLLVQADDVVIGDLMLRVQNAWAQTEIAERAVGVQAEIGWFLDPAHHGHGYATEAARDLLRLCFEELKMHRVEAQCFAVNEPSWRLMERLGMRREIHSIAESLHRSGQWMDGLGYAMLDREWASRS